MVTCSKHNWSLPTQNGCLSCHWDSVVEAYMASRGEDNDHAQDGNVQSHRRKAVGSLRAQNTFRTGKSIGQREARERAKLRRQAAVELLRNGNTALEVDEVLGMSPGWCYSAAAHHPSVRRALMGEEAAE